MTKPELIELIKLLSAIESWSFATKHPMPDYLTDKLDYTINLVTTEVLQ